MPPEIHPLISVGAVDTVISDDGPSNQLFRDRFARIGAAPLSGLLEPRFAQMLDNLCAKTGFVTDIIPNIGSRQIEAEPRLASKALCAALRRPLLLRWLSDTIGCGPLETVGGAITEISAHHGEALDWHEDQDGTGRKLAITINLSERPFEGGGFELRERASRETLFSHVHEAFGSALLFRVSWDFQHRVLPVTSGGPRRVFSGWFLGPTTPAA